MGMLLLMCLHLGPNTPITQQLCQVTVSSHTLMLTIHSIKACVLIIKTYLYIMHTLLSLYFNFHIMKIGGPAKPGCVLALYKDIHTQLTIMNDC